MKAQPPHKNTIQLVALATTAAPSTFQNIMFWNIDGAAKHLFIATVNCATNLFDLTSNIITQPLSQVYSFRRLTCRTVFINCSAFNVPKRIPSPAVFWATVCKAVRHAL